MRRRIFFSLPPAAFLALLLAACSHRENSDEAAGAGIAKGTPPIHVEQTLVVREHGAVVDEQNYRRELANCSHLSMPVRPLDAEVADKLGRTFYEAWYAGDHMAVKADDWKYAVRNVCEFSPVHRADLWIVRPDGTTAIDLSRRTGSFDPNVRLARATITPPPPGSTDSDDPLRAAVAAQLRRQGRSGLMTQDAGMDSDAGQPCQRKKDAISESCVWSGGAPWGFGEGGGHADSPVVSRIDSIELWEKPAQEGDGLYLTTQRMTVGEPVDHAVFEVPPGIAVEKK